MITAVRAVGSKFASALNKDITRNNQYTPWGAFRAIFGHVKFAWVKSYTDFQGNVYTSGAITQNAHLIEFASLSQPGGNRTAQMAFVNAVNNVVHELGHAFANLWWVDSDTYDPSGPYVKYPIPGRFLSNDGFYLYPEPQSAGLTWRQHPCGAGDSACGHETFADMFLGWTFDAWANDPEGYGNWRDEYMTTHMVEWVQAAPNR